MTHPFVTHAFIAGELDRPFYGRTDLEKYDLGVALARNWYVDFRGGLKTRPGFRFRTFAEKGRLVTFPTGEDEADLLVLLIEEKLFLLSEGEFIVDDPLEAQSVNGNTITFSGGHGIEEGDYLCGAIECLPLLVTAVAGNDVTVAPIAAGEFFEPEAGQNFYPIVTLDTPYSLDDLQGINFHFRLDRVVFTHPDYLPHELIFADDAFTFEAVDFESRLPAPTNLGIVTYSSVAVGAPGSPEDGNATVVVVVTAVDENGIESISSLPALRKDIFNYTRQAGSLSVSWDAVPGAKRYRVYRSLIAENISMTRGQPVGFIGETRAPVFVDNNIIPDFTLQPPILFNPFAEGAILEFDVTNGGSGYDPEDTEVSVTGGTGFVGYPLVVDGAIVSVVVFSGGSGYTTENTVSITGASGSGATIEVASVSPTGGLYPRSVTTFQERRVYAGSRRLPLTVYGSRPGAPENFDAGLVLVDTDSYAFVLDVEEAVPIRHLVPIRDGLLIFHTRGVERLLAEEGRAVTPLNRVIESQAAFGVGRPRPVLINNDVLFSTARGSSLIALSYTFYTNSYTPQDLTVLSPHLFGKGKEPVRFGWVEEPDKLLWVLREDGRMLCLTYLREQEIFAWTQHETDGFIHDICVVSEQSDDLLYALVEREEVIHLECLQPRAFADVREYWGVDAAVGRTYESPVTEIEGLWHLEGRLVVVLADGDAIEPQLVENGKVTLDTPASIVRVGLPYECLGRSLPLTDAQVMSDGRRKRIVGTAVRLFETRGLELGTAGGSLYEMRDKGYEDWGEMIPLRSDNAMVLHKARWERDAQLEFRQRYPLPATVLGFVTAAELEQ